MKTRSFLSFLLMVPVAIVVAGCGGSNPIVDLGDGSSGSLLWGVSHFGFAQKDYDKGLVYANKALEVYGDEARQMQTSLSDFPATEPPESAYKYKTLNNTGLAAFAKGELLLRKGDHAGAQAAYTMVMAEFGYAQFQDLGEWKGFAPDVARDDRGFIRLADLAQQRLADLEADSE